MKNLKRKIRPEEAHKINSPWNIAVDFTLDMSFSVDGIAGMLSEYEEEHHTGMDVERMAQEIRDYTGGYPFLVCRICQMLDKELVETERFKGWKETWTAEGIHEAVRRLLFEENTLFGSLMGKLYDNDELCSVLKKILFNGDAVSFEPDKLAVNDARMYGFIHVNGGKISIANRIFETRLYNYFLGERGIKFDPIYEAGSHDRELFIENGHLSMDKVLERFVVELKIWRGDAYKERGEEQLAEYLEYFHLEKGYMLSYNFNQKKETGVKEIPVKGKILVEAVV